MSAKRSSTKILQPSCSPKKLTLLPTTGPKSSTTGEACDVSPARNLRRALVAKTGSSGEGAMGGARSAPGRRGARRSNRPTTPPAYPIQTRDSGLGIRHWELGTQDEKSRVRDATPSPPGESRTPNHESH